MLNEKILYTDGHDVVVTDSTFRVRKQLFKLNKIIKHGFSIVKPNRAPGFLFIGLGLIGLTVGVSKSLDDATLPIQTSISVLGIESSILLIILGATLMVAGIVIIIALKERYGVHIVTEEGEKDVLVSDRREYVSIVVEALNKAFINMLRKTGSDESGIEKPMGMSVSHR
jgi:hypothetical protein